MSADASVTLEMDALGVATVVLNRPDKANCYDGAMLQTLFDAFDRFAADPSVRIVVLRGAGRHFCGGADIGAGSTRGGPGISDVCLRLDAMGKPAVGVIQGACIGGGLALAASCDVVIASRDAFFSLPEVRLGLSPGPLIPVFMHAMGYRNLRRYLLSGERFASDEAQRIGLVHRLCEAFELDATLAAQVDALLMAGPDAAAAAKATLRRMAGVAVSPEVIAELQAAFDARAQSAEAAEGRAAFKEKRKPSWSPPR